MGRRRLALLLGLPLVATSSLGGHALAYRLVEPDAHEHAELLADTGHAYLGLAPAFAGACLGTASIVLLLAGAAAVRGRRVSPPPWGLALLPPLAFVVQEHVERLAHSGELDRAVALEPPFVLGLLLQAPLALLALAASRLLLAAAERVAAGLATAAPRRLRAAPTPTPPAVSPRLVPIPVLASRHAGRAPPAAR